MSSFQKALHHFKDINYGGNEAVTGTVKIGLIPFRSRVRLYDAHSGVLLREQWTDDAGNYAFVQLLSGPEYTVMAGR